MDPVISQFDPASASKTVPLVIVGAGAAGLTTGIFAGRHGTKALLLETRARPGAKLRVSGGGRCNVLPSQVCETDFHTLGSTNAIRQFLQSWPLAQVRAFFEADLRLPLADEDTGKVFPASNDARDVLDALLGELARCGGSILGGDPLVGIETCTQATDRARFVLKLASGLSLRCEQLVLATGGKSLPKTGSDGFGFQLAVQLGHKVQPTYPALVPLPCPEEGWNALAGMATKVQLTAKKAGRVLEERTGDFLFTHRGFSGPVVLDLSWRVTHPNAAGTTLHAKWIAASGRAWEAILLAGGARSLNSALADELPKRLAAELMRRAQVEPSRSMAELPREERRRLLQVLEDCPLAVTGDEGYVKAEVTGGGVALDEVSTKTLESRLVPGLAFAGEILDLTGRLGGFNFLWAWISGRKAGSAAAQRCQA